MNPETTNVRRHTPILASEGWHRFITIICLLVCGVWAYASVAELFERAQSSPFTAIDYVRAAVPVLLSLNACRFLVREFRESLARARQADEDTRKVSSHYSP